MVRGKAEMRSGGNGRLPGQVGAFKNGINVRRLIRRRAEGVQALIGVNVFLLFADDLGVRSFG